VNAGQAALGTAFTYQGRLQDGDSPAEGAYDFRFILYDAESGGSQVGSTVEVGDVGVTNGFFTVEIDFGPIFTGEARFLEIGVRVGDSSGAYTTLSPRQELTPTPYALALPGVFPIDGKVGIGNTTPGAQLDVRTVATDTVYAIFALSENATAIYGRSSTSEFSDDAIGVRGRADAPDGVGVMGEATTTSPGGANGVKGIALHGIGVYGESGEGTGVGGFAGEAGGNGVIGHASATTGSGKGVVARVNSPTGTAIQAENGSGDANGEIIRGCSQFLCFGNSVVFRVRNNGNVTADGAFTGGGADYADLMAVSGKRSSYEPGDVLAIGPDGKLVKATSPYDTALAGVYSTQPAFLGDPLGTEGEELRNDNRVPVALTGIVPVKVSDENGAIRPGDLLTTSSTPGHAMKAEPVMVQGVAIYPTGAILGKALEPLDAGSGTIQVLIIQR
jgi:hypothetical protein